MFGPIFSPTPHYYRTSDFVRDPNAASQHLVQKMLNEIAAKNSDTDKRELVFDNRLSYNGSFKIPDNFSIIFEENGLALPLTNTTKIIDNQNILPSVPYDPHVPSNSETLYPLTADVLKGHDRITVGVHSAAFAVGDYLYIKDTQPITTSPNSKGLTQAQTARTVAIDNGQLILDCDVKYTYLVSTTSVGKITGNHNITLRNFHTGEIGGQVGGTYVDLRYIDNLKIPDDFRANNSRYAANADQTFNRLNVNALNIVGCSNVKIGRVLTHLIGWYGISLDAFCRNVTIDEFIGSFMRHGISTNWNIAGEVFHLLVKKLITNHTWLGGADMHDVGNDLNWLDIAVSHSMGDGGQMRTSNVIIHKYLAENCGGSGLSARVEANGDGSKLTNIHVKNVTCHDNAQRGITSTVPINIDTIQCHRNGGTTPSQENYGGIAVNGGIIKNADLQNNMGPALIYRTGDSDINHKKPLTLDNITAPYNAASQKWFLHAQDSFENQNVTIHNSNALDYPTAQLFTRAGTNTYITDIDVHGCKWSHDAQKITVDLVGGSATIINGNAKETSTLLNAWRSNISLKRIVAGVAPGILTHTINDGIGLTITSTSMSDNGRIEIRFD